MKEEVIFYFGLDSPFSHWYRCEFTIGDRTFCCVEQYLMLQKAMLFDDASSARAILRSADPRRHRYLGKHVRGFQKEAWQDKCRQFAFDGNYAKFSQNSELLRILLGTVGKGLAEASPYDRNCGIGLSAVNPKVHDRRLWRGKNWAGEVLEMVREKLGEETEVRKGETGPRKL